ncbi:GNAT family N-acetyltransferase [Loktanella salsilacus]|uniref:GNAT family N-acetyltransferase n=1 Tax=Loktanella salsilacus TaxID=195913 RepID=UPI0037355842
MTPEDLAATHALAFDIDRPWSAHEFASLRAQRGTLLCGDAKSFVLGRVIVDEAEILTVATAPDHRRQGLARNAIAAFCNLAQGSGAATVFLEVAADNAAAIALYNALGFGQVGQRRAYYDRENGKAVDALVLRRTLTP